jgi:hypothetical protein
MFGCIGRLVVLCVLLILGIVAYVTRGSWEPKLRERIGAKPAATATAAAPTWEPVTREGAARGRAKLEELKRPSGPVFLNVSAADLVAFAIEPLFRNLNAELPASAQKGAAPPAVGGPEALAGENAISVRGNIKMSDIGSAALGPLAGVLDGTQRIEVRGRLEVTAPGKGLYIVDKISLGNLVLPGAVIGRVVERMAPRTDKSIPSEAIPLAIPAEVADIRVTSGRVTMYKAVR